MKERDCSQCKHFDEKIVHGKYGTYIEPICKAGREITVEKTVNAEGCPKFEKEE